MRGPFSIAAAKYLWPWLILFSLAAPAACAQRLLVETTSMSAMRQAARVYVQCIDLASQTEITPPDPLPGNSPSGPILLVPISGTDAALDAIIPTEPFRDRDSANARPFWTFLSHYDATLLRKRAVLESEPGWRRVPACVMGVSGGTPPVIVVMSERLGEDGTLMGRVETFGPVTQAAPMGSRPQARWQFSGAPVTAGAFPDDNHLAVLCHKEDKSGTVLRMLALDAGPGHADVREITDDQSAFGSHPGGMALSKNGSLLFILTTGYAANRPSGEPISWLHALSTQELAPIGDPIELPGIPNAQENALQATGDNGCWALTRSPGSEFGHATKIAVQDKSLTKKAQIPLTEVPGSFRLVLSPAGGDVAVAISNRIEMWKDGVRGAHFEEFPSAITALAWGDGGLFIGGAGWLHQVAPDTLQILQTWTLQSGWVTDIVPLPPGLPHNTDGTGSPPLVLPRSDLPQSIEFDAAGAGQEIKALVLDRGEDRSAAWRIEYSRSEVPWLVIHPLSGTFPAVVYMGVDPGRCDTRALSQGTLALNTFDRNGDVETPLSSTPMGIRVIPEERSEIRRVLWILGLDPDAPSLRSTSDPAGLRQVLDRLAAPPRYFAHRENSAPFHLPLDPFTVVVVTASAMAQGALVRPDVLDYVIGGGGLLVIGAHEPAPAAPDSGTWLAPVGVQFDTATKVDGAFSLRSDITPTMPGIPGGFSSIPREVLEWLAAAGQLPISNGCAVLVDPPEAALAPVGEKQGQTAFFARRYGRGRIAVLASITPLQKNLPFALDLIGWLAGSGAETFNQDMDSDGLADEIEDINGNGAADPGETDYLKADSDLDGLPDGTEDTNLNGRIDDGETSPLNPDSDGDGAWDGADDTPLPASSSPIVSNVFPSEGPAEGGPSVLISGRNFGPDAVVWFGDKSSPDTRVLRPTELFAEMPPCREPHGGPADVRVVNASTGLEGILPGGFVYAPRTLVWLVAKNENIHIADDGKIAGTLLLACEPSRGGVVEQLSLLLTIDKRGGHWGETANAPSSPSAPRITMKHMIEGQVLVAAWRGRRSPSIKGVVATIPWTLDSLDDMDSAHINIENARAFSRNGQPLDVNVRNATINVRTLREKQSATPPAATP